MLFVVVVVVYLKDLKAGNVQDPDEVLARQRRVQGRVDPTHQPLKHPVVRGLGQGGYGVDDL